MAEPTANTRAVLKLRLGDEAGTRRIPLSRLWDVSKSAPSYDRLVAFAIEYTFPLDATPLVVENYDVAVTYPDEDGDTITVSTDEELAEAFAQFTKRSPPVLRARATVKRNGRKVALPPPSELEAQVRAEVQAKAEAEVGPPPAAPEAPTPPPPSAPSTEPRSVPPSAPGRRSQQQQPPAILESFAPVLASAVVAPQGHVAPPPMPSGSGGAVPGHSTAVATPLVAERARDHSRSPSPGPRGHEKAEAGEEGAKEEVKERDHKAEDGRAPEEGAEAPPIPAPIPVPIPVPSIPEGLGPEFIHGHHTCDGCLVTPIVGYRYHARNLPDVDLCGRCMGRRRGGDAGGVVFEPVELERDRPLLSRWRRRAKRRARAAGLGLGGGCMGRPPCASSSRIAAAAARAAGATGADRDLKEAMRRSLLDAGARRSFPPCASSSRLADLKEAIRRSLLDVDVARVTSNDDKEEELEKSADAKEEPEKVTERKEPEGKTPLAAGATGMDRDLKEAIRRSLLDAGARRSFPPCASSSRLADLKEAIRRSLLDVDVARVTSNDDKEEEQEKSADAKEEPEKVTERKEPEGKTPLAAPKAEDPEEEEAQEEPAQEWPAQEEEEPEKQEPAREEEPEKEEPEVVEATFQASAPEVPSLESSTPPATENEEEPQVKEEEDVGKETVIDEEEIAAAEVMTVRSEDFEKEESREDKPKEVEEPASPAHSKSSFSDDAEGSIAEAIGATFDHCAEAIDAIVYEFERKSGRSDGGKEELESDDEEAIVGTFDSCTEAIDAIDYELEEAEVRSVSSDESEDERYVVDEDIQRNEHIANDEMLAHAAQLIGSAMLQLDMSAGAEERKSGYATSSAGSSSSGSSSSSSSSSSSGSSSGSSYSAVSASSSVPSVPTSTSRWEPELWQLRVMGFVDDDRSVDALERLEAANIGVGSTDPVTLDDVVDYLLTYPEE